MTDSALWSCGVLGKVHGLNGELYLNLGPGGLERLELGETVLPRPVKALVSRVPAWSDARAARTSALSS